VLTWCVRALLMKMAIMRSGLRFVDLSMMNTGVGLLLLKTGRSLLECLCAYPLTCFESKSSVF
jgi:hypothetical protein